MCVVSVIVKSHALTTQHTHTRVSVVSVIVKPPALTTQQNTHTRVSVVSVIVKPPALLPCAADGRSRNPYYHYYYNNLRIQCHTSW